MLFFFFLRSSGPNEVEEYEMEVLNHETDEWEVSRDRLELREVIGSGAFGAVWRAMLSQPEGRRGPKQIVAAKCFTREKRYISLL